MNPWSLRCSKLALGKTSKVSVFLANTCSGCPWSGKVREKSLFSKPRNCQGFLTMNTNILSPVACPYEHKTEVK